MCTDSEQHLPEGLSASWSKPNQVYFVMHRLGAKQSIPSQMGILFHWGASTSVLPSLQPTTAWAGLTMLPPSQPSCNSLTPKSSGPTHLLKCADLQQGNIKLHRLMCKACQWLTPSHSWSRRPERRKQNTARGSSRTMKSAWLDIS